MNANFRGKGASPTNDFWHQKSRVSDLSYGEKKLPKSSTAWVGRTNVYSPFWELTFRSDPSTDFHAWWLKRRGLSQDVPFYWDLFTYGSPFMGLTTKNFWFGAWIGVFKPNSRNRKRACILSQELIRRWDSERELFYDDIAHVLQNTEKRTYFV